jgi:hypothetical protein
MIDDIIELDEISSETKLKILDYMITHHISDLISESKHNILKLMLYVTLLKEDENNIINTSNILSFAVLLGTFSVI